jgi:hypothetical protein
MEFESIALEELYLIGLAFDLLLVLGVGGVAEDRQTPVLLPELADAPADTLAGFGEAPLIGLGGSSGGHDEDKETGNEPMDMSHGSLLRLVVSQ